MKGEIPSDEMGMFSEFKYTLNADLSRTKTLYLVNFGHACRRVYNYILVMIY